MIITVLAQMRGRNDLPNPNVRIRRDGAGIHIEVDLVIELESEEHRGAIVIRHVEIQLWRWRDPFRVIHLPAIQLIPADDMKPGQFPLILGPLQSFKGWFVHRAVLPIARFPTDWRSTLVISFRGARRRREPLVINWDAPLDAWNKLLEDHNG